MREAFKAPAGLSKEGRAARSAILKLAGYNSHHSGAKAFWTPKEWAQRSESYGCRSELIIVHECSELGRFLSYDERDYAAINRLNAALEKLGLFAEQCTSWYSAVYKREPIVLVSE
jgi:hypothetical protein